MPRPDHPVRQVLDPKAQRKLVADLVRPGKTLVHYFTEAWLAAESLIVFGTVSASMIDVSTHAFNVLIQAHLDQYGAITAATEDEYLIRNFR